MTGTAINAPWALFIDLSNTIIYHNEPGVASIRIGHNQVLAIDYCDFEGGRSGIVSAGGTVAWGSHNIQADPLLLADGFHLAAGSPCRDAGLSSLVAVGEKDIDGEDRIYWKAVDIGADEVQP